MDRGPSRVTEPVDCGRSSDAARAHRSPRRARADPSVGLCSVCAHARVTGNRRGSIFWLCRLSGEDARYPRYPRLPVTRCPGFEPTQATRANHQE